MASESTICYHAPLCANCRAIVWEAKTPCTPVKGTATCISADLCSVCGFPDAVNGVLNPNAHHLSGWVNDSSQQHYRYCTYCGADDTYEYEDHSGGKATCIVPAVCEVCDSGYGELSTEHALSEWRLCSATEHRKYCILCSGPDTFLYEEHYGGKAPVSPGPYARAAANPTQMSLAMTGANGAHAFSGCSALTDLDLAAA